MKVLLLSEIFPPVKGGSGRWFWEIYTRLPHEQYIVCAGAQAGAEAFDKGSPLKTYRLNLTSPSWGLKSLTGLLFYWRMFWQLRAIIKKEGVTILHCGRAIPEGFIALLIKWFLRIPYLTYVHGEDVETARTSRELTWIVSKSLKGASKIICNSHNSKQLLIDNWGIDEQQIIVMHPGVDCSKFVPLSPEEQEAKKPEHWRGRTVLLTVGRLQKRKGHDMLIQALPEIRKRVPDILYSIIGDGAEKAHLEALIRANQLEDVVEFAGEISDDEMLLHYQCCDLFILPNRTVNNDIEGFGIVMLEAQACGKPVIAGDSGGTKETMKIGETGWVLDCSKESALAENLVGILVEKDLSELTNPARDWVLSQFDWAALSQNARLLFEKQEGLL